MLTMRMLTLSMIMAIESTSRFCVSSTHERFQNDLQNLSDIFFWFRKLDRGGAVYPCQAAMYSWMAKLSATGELEHLKRFASFGALCKEGGHLMTHLRRAEAAAAEVVGSLRPSSLSLDDAVSSAMLHVSTWCEDCEEGCPGCSAKRTHRRVKKLRDSLTSFEETLSVLMAEVRGHMVERACEELRRGRKRRRPSEWEKAQGCASRRRV
ncbi:hypothetical protein FGB62_3g253 [Gracilaria domingensis]|nr:hypothetical protein FGB62_3g253 [Gracilaria domingensis]